MNTKPTRLRFLKEGVPTSRDRLSETISISQIPNKSHHPIWVNAAGISRWNSNEGLIRTCADTWAMDLITHGQGSVTLNGRTYPIHAGHLITSERGSDLSLFAANHSVLHKRFVVFTGSMARDNAEILGLFPNRILLVQNPSRTAALMRQIFRIISHKQEGYMQKASGLLLELMLFLSESPSGSLPDPLVSALGFIEKNLHRNVSLEDIVKHSRMSKRTCNRLFKNRYGISPVKYFETRKLQKAKSLLEHTVYPIQSIADSLGYTTPQYFSNHFKKHFLQSPRDFRNRIVRIQTNSKEIL